MGIEDNGVISAEGTSEQLWVKTSDVRFHVNGNGSVHHLSIKPNKLLELRMNGLVTEDGRLPYTKVCLIHGEHVLTIPVNKDKWSIQTNTRNNHVLRASIAEKTRFRMKEFQEWKKSGTKRS